MASFQRLQDVYTAFSCSKFDVRHRTNVEMASCVDLGLTSTLCLSFQHLMGLARFWVRPPIWWNLIRNLTISVFLKFMKNFYFTIFKFYCWDAFSKYGHKYFFELATFWFFIYMFFLNIRQDNFSLKARNTIIKEEKGTSNAFYHD